MKKVYQKHIEPILKESYIMDKKQNILWAMLLCLCFSTVKATTIPPAPIKYVKEIAAGTADGSSWANASSNLQAMIDASPEYGEVWVATGTYKPATYPTGSANGASSKDFAFILKDKVKVYGGFVGTETTLSERTIAVILANPSILSGDINATPGLFTDDAHHVVISVNDDMNTRLDGFTIAYGNAHGVGSSLEVESNGTSYPPEVKNNEGGGLNCNTSNPTIQNCIFLANKTVFSGGAVYNKESSPTFINCSFQANSSTLYGGAIYNTSFSSPLIDSSSFTGNLATQGAGIFNAINVNPSIKFTVFTNNQASEDGGAIYNAAASPTIENCVFSLNNATSGGGAIYNSSNSSAIINCLFNENSSTSGGGLYNASASTVITNATFWGNSSLITGGGGAIFNTGFASNSLIRNSIFKNNKKNNATFFIGSDIENVSNAKTTITNSLLQLGNSSTNYPSSSGVSGFQGAGTGNFYQTDPFFVTSSNPIGPDNVWGTDDDGLILQNCSPLLQQGNNTYNATGTDLQDNLRIHNTTIDMGAYENQFGTMEVLLTRNDNGNPYVCEGETTIFTATPTFPGLFPMYEFFLNDTSLQSGTLSTLNIDTLEHDDIVKVRLTSQACTANSNAIQMVVNAPVLVTTTNSPVCAEKLLTMSTTNTVSGTGNNYLWTGPAFLIPNTEQSPSFLSAEDTMSGKYYVTVTDVFLCTTDDSVTVLVNPLPIPSVSSNTPVCAGQILQLNSSNLEVATLNFYSWTGPTDAFPISQPGSDQNPKFDSATVGMTGNYVVTITDNNGCTTSANTSVIVNSRPIPSASDNSPVCAGQELSFFSSDTRPSPVSPLAFTWTGPAFNITNNMQNPKFDSATMAMNGIYTVSIEDANGCVDSTTTTVIVRSLPIPALDYNNPVCAEDSIFLFSTDTRDPNFPSYNYSWRGPKIFSSSLQNPKIPESTVDMSGEYFLTMADVFGCVDSTKFDVLVRSLPIPQLTYNPNVCTEDTLKLNVIDTRATKEPAYSYAWTGPLGFDTTAQGFSLPNSFVNMTGTYIVNVTDQYGCAEEDSISVIVHSLPIPQLAYNPNVCQEDTLKLNVIDIRAEQQPAYSYAWAGPLGFDTTAQGFSIPNSIVNMTGKYYVNVTDQFGCAEYDSINVIVHSLPIPSLSYNPNVCTEDTLKINVIDTRATNQPSYSYAWTGPLGFDTTAQGFSIPNSIVNMTGKYYVNVTDQYGCSEEDSLAVIVHSLPIPSLSYNPNVCTEDTLKINVIDTRATKEPVYSYAWTGPLGFDTTAQGFSLPNSFVNMTGTYIVNVTDQYGCAEEDSLAVIVHSLPIPQLAYNPNVCQEDTLKLNVIDIRAEQRPAYSYAWAGPLGFDTTAQGFSIPNSIVNMTGKYYVNVTDQYGCAEYDSINVIVHSLPIPSLSYNPNVCTEDTLKINVIDTRATNQPSYSYAWTGPLDFDTTAQGFSLPNSIVNMTGKYYVNVTDQFGCAEYDSIDVIVHSLPIPSLSYNPNVCTEDTLKINVIDTRATKEPVYSYAWTGPLGFDTTAQGFSLPNSFVNMTGTYIVNVTDQYGCAEEDSLAVIVHSLPIPQLAYNPNVCQEDTLKLNVIDIRAEQQPAYTYAWTGPLGFDTTAQGFSIPNSSVNMTGKYYVNVTDQYGCAEEDSIDVIVHSLPVPTASYNPFVCAEKTLQLSSSDSREAKQPAYTYNWKGPLLYNSTEQNPTINNTTVDMSGSYEITITDTYGCSASTSTEVIVHALPEAIASSNSPVCSAETLNLLSEDERTTQESPYTYAWTGPNDFTSELQNPIFNSVSVSLTGIYSVTITDEFGCKSTASTDVINHHPTATATNGSPYKESEDVNLLATGGTRFDWTGPNGFTSNLVNPTIPNTHGANSGTYTVTVTFEFCSVTATTAVNIGCSSPSLSYYLIYADGTTPEVITPISQGLEIQKSSRPMTVMAIPSCSSPTLESLRLTISGVETETNRLYVDNEAPFRLHENTGNISGVILPPTLYTFISRAFDLDNALGNLLIGPDNIQFWIVNGIRDILIPNLTATSVCAGSSFNISSSSTGEFSVGNIYQAFLSDENGGFSDPILVGSSADPSSINCTIPNYIKGGNNYKIMVRSSAPVVSSVASSLSLSISPASNSLISPNNDLNNISTSRNAIFTIDASNKIMGTSNIIYKAQYNVTLKPGFEASPGTVFSAEIGDACL